MSPAAADLPKHQQMGKLASPLSECLPLTQETSRFGDGNDMGVPLLVGFQVKDHIMCSTRLDLESEGFKNALLAVKPRTYSVSCE